MSYEDELTYILDIDVYVRACVRVRACSVRIQGSRPGIMWTCIVSITSIAPIVSEREGLVCLDPRSHRNAGLQPLLHAHVIREDDAQERQSQSSAQSAATGRSARARVSLRDPLRNKRLEVGKGLSLADTQTDS